MTISDDYAILFVGANGCSPVSGFQCRLYGMTMSDDYAILFVGANGCSPVIGFQGRLYGMTPLHVILTMLLVRIPVSREKRDRP